MGLLQHAQDAQGTGSDNTNLLFTREAFLQVSFGVVHFVCFATGPEKGPHGVKPCGPAGVTGYSNRMFQYPRCLPLLAQVAVQEGHDLRSAACLLR